MKHSSNPRRSIRLSLASVAALLLVWTPPLLAEDDYRLYIGISGQTNEACGIAPGEDALMAGAVHTLGMNIRPMSEAAREQFQYAGVESWTWPDYVELEFAVSPSGQADLVPVPELREQLAVQYYVEPWDKNSHEYWRSTGNAPDAISKMPHYHFFITVPGWLTGQFLCIRARVNHPVLGELTAGPVCYEAVAPCNDGALQFVWLSLIHAQYRLGHYERTVALADSLVPLGLKAVVALKQASQAAVELQRYDDALRFLDLCWTRAGTLNEFQEGGRTPPEMYHQARQHLLDLQSQQQQR